MLPGKSKHANGSASARCAKPHAVNESLALQAVNGKYEITYEPLAKFIDRVIFPPPRRLCARFASPPP
jgi:hypothetical protein